MRCPICKSEIPQGSAFCNICGKPVNSDNSTEQNRSVKHKFSDTDDLSASNNKRSPKEAVPPEAPINQASSKTSPATASPAHTERPAVSRSEASSATPVTTVVGETPAPVYTPNVQKKKKSKLIPFLLILIALAAVGIFITAFNEDTKGKDFNFGDEATTLTDAEVIYTFPENEATDENRDTPIISIKADEIIEYFDGYDDAYYKVYGAGNTGLNLRTDDNTDAEIIRVLQESELVLVYGIENGWAFIKTADPRTEANVYGWCSADYLKYSHTP